LSTWIKTYKTHYSTSSRQLAARQSGNQSDGLGFGHPIKTKALDIFRQTPLPNKTGMTVRKTPVLLDILRCE
jgi:hypothetical protein